MLPVLNQINKINLKSDYQVFKYKHWILNIFSYVEEEPFMGLRQYQQSGIQYQYSGQYNVPGGQAAGDDDDDFDDGDNHDEQNDHHDDDDFNYDHQHDEHQKDDS